MLEMKIADEITCTSLDLDLSQFAEKMPELPFRSRIFILWASTRLILTTNLLVFLEGSNIIFVNYRIECI